MIERSPQKLIVEIESIVFDAPYSDHFVIKSAWVVVGITTDCCLFHEVINIVFSKRTILKNKLVDGINKGYYESHLQWLELAKKGNHLDKPPEPIPEPVAIEVEEEPEES